MARAARQRRENELPYIPFGPFQIRFPFIHYKIESVEFIQGLILGVTALAAVPYLEQYLGLPYELACPESGRPARWSGLSRRPHGVSSGLSARRRC